MLVALTGAGISTESGIPDFRSPGGIWERFDPDAFHVRRLRANPATFWEHRRKLIAGMRILEAEPNDVHHLLADAARAGRLKVITQNVDGLHQKAGTPEGCLIELHGNGAVCRCDACGYEEAMETTVARVGVPRCSCGAVLRPGVVLFGEPVPAMRRASQWVSHARRLFVLGSSLQVHPAAGLVDAALALGVPVTIMNREPTPYDAMAEARRGPLAKELRKALAEAGAPASHA